MSRGFGEVEFVQGIVPDALAPVVALVTQLGDVWFLALVVAILYVRSGRERFAVVGARAIGGLGVLFALKYYFALPRPDAPLVALEAVPTAIQPLYAVTGFAGGYGFPSGHATFTTIVYGSLVGALAVGTARRRAAVAAALVAAVSLSRVTLGVHYLVDVVAGVAVGLAFLGVTAVLFDRAGSERTTVAFVVAVACATVGALASDFGSDPTLLLAAGLGGLAGWSGFRLAETAPAGRRTTAHAAAVALSLVGLAVVTALAVDPVPGLPAVVGLAAAAGVVAPIVRTPERGRPARERLGDLGSALDPRRD